MPEKIFKSKELCFFNNGADIDDNINKGIKKARI
jgi:hypothetical protein